MTAILVSYQGAPVALAGPRDTHLLGRLATPRPGDPDTRFALYMTHYAQQVARGQLPGPYTDHDAQRFARAALINPRDLYRHHRRDDAWLAARLRVPELQIRLARHELKTKQAPAR